MKTLVDVAGLPLQWSQPSALKMHYALRTGDDVVATLEFRSMFGSFATGRMGDGCWTFKRVGFWQTRATIRECDGEQEIGNFRNNLWSGGGGLELPDGRRFLATTNIWLTKLEFQDESGTPLFRLKSRGVVRLGADVTIEHHASQVAELPWMTLLGWYVMVMMSMDAVAGGAAAAGG